MDLPLPRDAMRDRFRQLAVEFNVTHPDLWADVSYERSNGGVRLMFYRLVLGWKPGERGQKFESLAHVTIGVNQGRAYPVVEWHGNTLSAAHQQAIGRVIAMLRG